ncbi:MAG: polysaccharide biosynthesis/export family protein [Paludibacteraceae bacterium]|nr:polysaccharide biosynthesis/export family protein [Paludibacteraceae bacterium]
MVKNLVKVFIVVLAVSSCVTPKRVNYLQTPGGGIPSYNQVNTVDDYKLEVGDQVYINVSTLNEDSKKLFSGSNSNFAESSASSSSSVDLNAYTIFSDGKIDFPFIGSIKIAGQTAREAKDSVLSKLKVIIPDCDVDLRLANSFFTVVGVAASGRFPITKEKLTVFQALAISGDLKSFSDRAKIHVLRPTENGTLVKSFDVRSKDIINSEYYYIRPNDVIYVQAFKGQFFGFETFSSVITTVSTTLSFGYLLYHLVLK